MILAKRVGKLAAAAAAEAGPRVYMGWSCDVRRLDAGQLGPGEYIAVDLVVSGQWVESLTERVTGDDADLGSVRDRASGELCGRVVSIDGDLVSFETAEGPAVYAAPESTAASGEAAEDGS